MSHLLARRFWIILIAICCVPSLFAITKKKRVKSTSHKAVAARKGVHKAAGSSKAGPSKAAVVRRTTVKPGVSKTMARSFTASTITATRRPNRSSLWKEPSFADSTEGDNVDGEDLVVRRAAVEALGPFNGSVVVTDPFTGRVLTMVNQKLALKSGFQPCSTIKIVTALAGLNEGVITPETIIKVGRKTSFDLTEALAKSNNPYFAKIGEKLGFDRVAYYAHLLGLGEKAGMGIEGEEPGSVPAKEVDLGVGMMTSFGSGIRLTPLELASLVSAVANGGTLYYLQYPKSEEEAQNFVPRIKRKLELEQWLPAVRPGMMGAVEHGTARRAGFDPDAPILGKTGTCTDENSPTHLGWFGSYNEVGKRKLVVVVLLTGGKSVSGPIASGVAGNVYKNLEKQNFFSQTAGISPSALVGTGICCMK